MSENGQNPDLWTIPTPLAKEIINVLVQLPWWQVGPLMKELEPYAVFRPAPQPVEIHEGTAT